MNPELRAQWEQFLGGCWTFRGAKVLNRDIAMKTVFDALYNLSNQITLLEGCSRVWPAYNKLRDAFNEHEHLIIEQCSLIAAMKARLIELDARIVASQPLSSIVAMRVLALDAQKSALATQLRKETGERFNNLPLSDIIHDLLPILARALEKSS